MKESNIQGRVVAVCVSEKKGTRKRPVESVELIENYGIKGDAHAGFMHRQISLLPVESAAEMDHPALDIKPGDFAENILTEGIKLKELPVGTILKVGEATLRITQIGKECHNDCEIKKLCGRCVMPTDGVFAEVIKGGVIKPDDMITITE